MFEIPEAKRVRREDLYSPQSSPRSSPDPELTELFHAHIQQEFEPTTVVIEEAQHILAPIGKQKDDNSPELEFRLFARTKNDAQVAPQKIRLDSPTAENGEPGFINPERDKSYYLADPSSRESLEYDAVAVTGNEVSKWARKPCPGCVLPWRVTTITMKDVTVHLGQPEGDAGPRKRRRLGKKGRIVMRKRRDARNAERDLASRLAAEEEAAEREKRTRRNREKKVKKRERDKAKKNAGTEGEAGVEV
ncbi:hypothetical protein M501DRAFT_1002775 [Patellaria atrata CBS 101060]|uniref:Uncharacterized protein n=1 Tax=Patellaria atrata CBS 101060 TaxID=1346257 RepID=A0A9P4SCY3_9PEZI|nr:hypothetical protein M501DRAFT_1002775 [Patellaria atrata CBS 101060]